MNKKLDQIIKISRPRFWIYLAGPYLIGFLIGANTPEKFLSFEFISYFIGFLFFGNLIVYGINDIYDQEADRNNPKKEEKESRANFDNLGLIKNSVILGGGYFLLVGFNALFEVQILLLLFIILSHQYSAPPIRAKERLILDSSFNFLYVIPGIIGYVQSGGKELNLGLLVGAFCWTFAMHLFSAMVDIKWDKEAKIKTTATELGFDNSRKICIVLWMIFGTITFIKVQNIIGLVVFIYPALAGISKETTIERNYWLFPKINAIIGLIGFFWLAFEKGWLRL